MRRRPDRADRLLVVHPQRPEQADGAERPVREAVGGADERDVAQRRVARARRRRGRTGRREPSVSPSISRIAARFSSASSRLLARLELVRPHLAEQARGAADEEPLLRLPLSSVNAGRRTLEELALRAREARVLEPRCAAVRVPSSSPASRSFRYSPAHVARPGSTGSANAKTRFVTPPVEVITTTIRTCGWSSSTSTWRTVAVSSGGAETSASSRVTCESVSVVSWSAASTSLRAAARSSGNALGPRLEPLEQPVDVEAVAALGRDAARRRCADA